MSCFLRHAIPLFPRAGYCLTAKPWSLIGGTITPRQSLWVARSGMTAVNPASLAFSLELDHIA